MKPDWKVIGKIVGAGFLLFLCIYYWRDFAELLALLWHAAAPLLIGAAVAYILNILMSFYERHYFPHSRKPVVRKSRRAVCMVGAFVTLITLIALLFWLVIPKLYDCVRLLLVEVPAKLNIVLERLSANGKLPQNISEYLEKLDWQSMLSQGAKLLSQGLGSLAGTAWSLVSSAMSSTFNLLLGVIFAIYLLAGKERLRHQCIRVLNQYVRPAWTAKLRKICVVLDDCFHRYIVGQCTEALILCLLCLITMQLLRFPYAPIIATVIGFTALIPVAGAYIGGAVGFLLILTESPTKAFLFIVYLVILQQLEGNLIFPRVVGGSLGLPGIWILATVTVCGSIFGIGGMIIGVPIVTAIYRIWGSDLRRREKAASADISLENKEQKPWTMQKNP